MQIIANKHKDLRFVFIILAIAALLISFSNLAGPVQNLLGTNTILDENRAFLQQSDTDNHKDILLITEVLAVVKLISSTDIGVNLVFKADVEVGQALHGLAVSIEYALWVVLASSVVIEVWKLLIETADMLVPLLFRATLFAIVVYLVADSVRALSQIRESCYKVMQFSLLSFATVFLLVPYALNLTAWVSRVILQPSTFVHNKGLGALQSAAENAQKGEELFKYWGSGKAVRSHLIDLHRDIQPHTSNVFEFMVNALAVNIISGIVVPLVSFYLLWLILTWFFSHIKSYHYQQKTMP